MTIKKPSLIVLPLAGLAILISLYAIRVSMGNRKPQTLRPPSNEYSVNQNPEFSVVYAGETEELTKNTAVYAADGEKVDLPFKIKEDTEGKKTIVLEPGHAFRPGKYTVKVQDGTGTTFEQNFSWGVLAINTDKPSYLPGEDAKLELAVLDENGDMVCDADLVLQIKDPNGAITELQTQFGDIKVNPECNLKDFTLNPDYEAVYKTNGTGVYKMMLNAKTQNGEFSIEDNFYVKTDSLFEIRRKTATRIYPPKSYPVTIEIKANRRFKGVVEERVPLSFTVSPNQTGLSHNFVKKEKTEQLVTWEISMKKGETRTLTYTYDAPDISPQFYLLGPLSIYDESDLVYSIYKEERIWQIASDAIAFEEVDSGTAESAAVDTVTTTSMTGVADDLYLAAVATKPDDAIIDSVSGLGLTWTLVKDQCSARNQTRIAVYKAQGTPSGNGSITVNFTSFDGGAAVAVTRYSGVHASSPIGNIDAANTDGVDSLSTDSCDGSGTDSNSYSFATLDTSQANSIVYSATNTRSRTHTAGTGYTEREDVQSGATGNSSGVAIQDKLFASATNNLTVDGTFSGSPNDWSVVALEIKIAAAATNTPTPTATPTPAGPNYLRINGFRIDGIRINYNWPFFKINRFLAQT